MLKVGVIGCGYWGPNLIRNFHGLPDAEVVAIADLSEKRLAHVGLLYPGALKTTDHRRLIADPAIDAVVVATPMTTHYELGRQVLEAGKHLFIEKPMATTSADCRALIELAARRERILMVGHTFIYTPAVRKIKSLIDSGELGDIYYVNIQRVNLGIFQKDANVVWDLAPHDVAMLNFLFDADPVRVSAHRPLLRAAGPGRRGRGLPDPRVPRRTCCPHPRFAGWIPTRSATAPSWAAARCWSTTTSRRRRRSGSTTRAWTCSRITTASASSSCCTVRATSSSRAWTRSSR